MAKKNKKKNKNNNKKQNKKKSKNKNNPTKGILSKIGGSVGSYFGPIGTSIGSAAGSLLGSIFGMGDYTVSMNSLVNNSSGPPLFTATKDGVILSHREYLNDITSSVALNITTYPINPGNFITFPWLSTVANAFQEYEFLGLIFEYKATSAVAVNSTNTALGQVIMTTNYDITAPTFTTKQQMEAYLYTVSTSPAVSAIHPIECKPGNNPLGTYFVSDSSSVDTDQRFSYLGLLNVATVGMQAASVIGELWVSYHIKLKKPKMPSPLGSNLVYAHIANTLTATAANPTGTAAARAGSTMNFIAPGATSASIDNTSFALFYPGVYNVNISWYGATISNLPSITNGANISQTPSVYSANSNWFMYGYTSATSYINCVLTVTLLGYSTANHVTISCPGLSNGTCDIFVSQISSGVTLKEVTGKDEVKLLTPSFTKTVLCIEDIVDDYINCNCSNHSCSSCVLLRSQIIARSKFDNRSCSSSSSSS